MADDEYVYDDEGSEGGEGDAGEDDDEAIHIENKFYEAEEAKTTDPRRALALFEEVVAIAKAKQAAAVKWQWKGLEQMVVLRAQLGAPSAQISSAFSELLTHMNKVTPNEVNETINTVLDAVSSSLTERNQDLGELDRMYAIALDKLKESSNERLWFSANLRRGKAFLDRGEYDRLAGVVQELLASPVVSSDEGSKSTYLLEVHALEIALYGATKDKHKMREAYEKTQKLGSAVQDPRIMGGIHESGGKMLLEEGKWKEAYDEFFMAFRHMQDAGDARAKQNLKYVVLANILSLSKINPFDSREAKVYQNDDEIKAMLGLRNAFEQSDIKEFQRILADPRAGVANDAVIGRHVSNMLRTIRFEVLTRLVRPYNRVRVDFLAREIGVAVPDAEQLLVHLILDRKIEGAKLDQQAGILDLAASKRASSAGKKFATLQGWTASLDALNREIASRVVPAPLPSGGGRGGGGGGGAFAAGPRWGGEYGIGGGFLF